MEILDIYLSEYQARLFPLRKRRAIGDEDSKKPLVENWQNSTFTRKDLANLIEQNHPIGWALGPDDLVIDVDAPSAERPNKKGNESLQELEKILGAQLTNYTVEVQSPTGGRHFYLTKPTDLKVRKAIRELPGIDFLSHGQYVVIAGSPHWQGNVYKFSEMTSLFGDYQRKPAPPLLLDLIKYDPTEAGSMDHADPVSGSLLAKMLSELDPCDYKLHENWFRIFAACHSATGGSEEGLNEFVIWSTSDPDYQDAEEDIRKRWSTLQHKDGEISIATLFRELRDLGKMDVVNLVRANMQFDGEPVQDVLPEVCYGMNELKANDELISHLTKCPGLFQRAGSLVKITDSGIAPLNALGVCEFTSSVCQFMVQAKKGWAPARIPERVGRQIADRGSWFGIPALRNVVNTPVLTKWGVLQTPGYDGRSGVFYKKTIDVSPVPENPTKSQALISLERLADIVVDFPFLNDAHRSTWLAGLLGVFARPAIEGPLPIFLVDGNQAAVGKSLLVDAINLIAYGQPTPRSKLSTDDEEVAKMLLSVAVQNYGMYCFDNLENGADFGCPALDAVLTSRSVRGRILGQSRIIDAEIDTIFWATGNRVGISKDSDSFRRICFISLLSKDQDPKSRSNFKHGSNDAEFQAWCIENRATFIRDALLVLQFAKNCRDDVYLKPWGSYSAFSEIVRRALVLCGRRDPIEARDDVEIFNEEADEVSLVVNGLKMVMGLGKYLTAGEIYSTLRKETESIAEADPIVTAALETLAPSHLRDPSKAAAKRLRSRFRDRPANGFWIKAVHSDARNQLCYGVEKV